MIIESHGECRKFVEEDAEFERFLQNLKSSPYVARIGKGKKSITTTLIAGGRFKQQKK